MAGVTVHTGPVDAYDNLHNVPRERWRMLHLARRYFVQSRIPADCRMLLQFVEDAAEMHAELGYASVEDYIRRGGNRSADRCVGGGRPSLLKPRRPCLLRWQLQQTTVQELAAELADRAAGVRLDSSNHPARTADRGNQITLTSSPVRRGERFRLSDCAHRARRTSMLGP